MNQVNPETFNAGDKAKIDFFYSKLRKPKKTGWANYAPGSEDRIINRLQTMGVEVEDLKIINMMIDHKVLQCIKNTPPKPEKKAYENPK